SLEFSVAPPPFIRISPLLARLDGRVSVPPSTTTVPALEANGLEIVPCPRMVPVVLLTVAVPLTVPPIRLTTPVLSRSAPVSRNCWPPGMSICPVFLLLPELLSVRIPPLTVTEALLVHPPLPAIVPRPVSTELFTSGPAPLRVPPAREKLPWLSKPCPSRV